MNVEKNEAIERTVTTVLKLTSEDIIEALAKGNARLFKGAETTVAAEVGGKLGDVFEHLDVLVVTVRQTVTRQRAPKGDK